VRSVRDGARVRQELVASLGRRDLLAATGKLDQLLQALSASAPASGHRGQGRALRRLEARSWGPALVAGRLWAQQGPPAILERRRAAGSFESERAVALACSGCARLDLQGAAWAETVEALGFADLALHHFYCTLPWPRPSP
jgi:hypothetical protein